MPYKLAGASNSDSNGKDPPPYVMKLSANQQHQWVDVWNSSYKRCMGASGADDQACQQKAFAQASGVAKADDPDIAEIDAVLALANVTEKPWDGAASRFDNTDHYCKSSLIDENEPGQPKTQAMCHLPIMEPDGTLNINAVRNAMARLPQTKASDASKSTAQKKLQGLLDKHGSTAADDSLQWGTVVELRLSELGNGNLPEWQQVHRLGEYAIERASGLRIKLTQTMGDTIIRNYQKGVVRRGVPLDERHQTDQDGHALGWMKDVRWGRIGEGLPNMPEPSGSGPILYARWKYNKLGNEKLGDEQFKYTSPQYHLNYVDKETGMQYGPAIVAVAATNNPFLRQRSFQGEEAPDPIILSDGIKLSDDSEDANSGGNAMPPEDVARLNDQITKLSEMQAAAEVRLAEAEARTKEAMQRAEIYETRLAEESRLRHFGIVEAYLSDLIHQGLPPALAVKAAAILRNSSPTSDVLIKLGDSADAPEMNLYSAVKSLLEDIPKMPVGGALTRGSDIRPPAQLTQAKLDEETDRVAKEWVKAARMDRPESGNNNTIA